MEGSYRITYEDFLSNCDDTEQYFKFTSLREPMERLISAYFEVLRGNRPDNMYNTIACRDFTQIQKEPERFTMFLDNIEKDGFFDSHLKPQNYFLTDKEGNCIDIDKYLFFDSIVTDYNDLCTTLEKRGHLPSNEQPKPLAHMNSFAKGSKKGLLDLVGVNKTLFRRVQTLYEKDFMLYDLVRADTVLNESF